MDFNIEWTDKNYNEYINYLISLKDDKYKCFHSSLIPNINNIIGVRTPVLKSIAKKIYKGNYKEFLKINKYKYYEEIIIRGFVIGLIKEYDDELIKYINKHINLIDNWATCDLFVSNLHIVKKYKDEFWILSNDLIKSNNYWYKRTGYVLLLSYFIENKYLDDIFYLCDNYNTNYYYVQMAVSWLISICYIKYPDITIKYIMNNKLDTFTHNKTISKIIDSTRIKKEIKDELKLLKR